MCNMQPPMTDNVACCTARSSSCFMLEYHGGPHLSDPAWRSLMGEPHGLGTPISFPSTALWGSLENAVISAGGTWETPRVLTLRLGTGSGTALSIPAPVGQEPPATSQPLKVTAGSLQRSRQTPASLGDPGPVSLPPSPHLQAGGGNRNKGSFQLGTLLVLN